MRLEAPTGAVPPTPPLPPRTPPETTDAATAVIAKTPDITDTIGAAQRTARTDIDTDTHRRGTNKKRNLLPPGLF
jgi:hypothetical protein